MTTKTIFLHPYFDKNIQNKIHNNIEVKSQNILSIELAMTKYYAAIATNGFSSKTDGVYVFALKIDRIGAGNLMIGLTDLKNYDSADTGYAGRNPEFAGTSLNCAIGQRHPGGVDYLPANVVQSAQEIISILTISSYGGKKEIRWIADGNEGPLQQCHKAFGNGDEIFPCISFGSNGQQVEFIPFDQVKFHSPLIEKFLREYSSSPPSATSQGNAAVASFANNYNQQQNSTVVVAQLQQELEKERQRGKLLEAQLQHKDQQHGQVIQQKDAEIERLRQLLNPSPFAKDKLYQIDFAANGIIPPADPNAFGALLKLPSAASSPLFNEIRSMFRTAGSQIPVPSPVAGFELKEIEVINADIALLESRMRRLQQLRAKDTGTFFNPSLSSFTAEQLQTLIALRDQFLPRPSNATDKTPNLVNVFHGTKVEKLDSVVHGLVAVRSTDVGFFGLGVYTTTSIEYAAKYARGDFDANNGPYPPRASDGCVPVVWCVAAVGVCYPLTREVDYSKKRVHEGMEVSDFFGAPLTPGYDCHCAGVSQTNGFQAVPRKDMQYMEVVFDQEAQVLPIAVLWMKPM